MNYLFKSRHSIYYFRIVVPEACRASLGKTEVRRSLRTRSKREALVRASKMLLEAQEVFDKGYQFPTEIAPIERAIPKLSEALSLYIESQKQEGVSNKTLRDKQAQITLLSELIGNKPVNYYTIHDARKLKETAIKLPVRVDQIIKNNPDKTLSQIIKDAKGKSNISTTTYNHYINKLNSLFEYCIEEEYIEKNPFKRCKIALKAKASSYRGAYTPEQLSLILGAVKDSKIAYQRWLPFLALYTGARLNELSQLYKEDIKVIEGIHCIHIQALKPDQRVKNLSSERVIPIHSKLIDLGFIDYVGSLKSNSRVFPEIRFDNISGYSHTPSRWFMRFRKKLGISDSETRLDFHSFRHTVADSLKQQGYSENLIGAILGHHVGGITSNRYGKSFKPSILLPVINAIEAIDV